MENHAWPIKLYQHQRPWVILKATLTVWNFFDSNNNNNSNNNAFLPCCTTLQLHAFERHSASWPAGPMTLRHFDFNFFQFLTPGTFTTWGITFFCIIIIIIGLIIITRWLLNWFKRLADGSHLSPKTAERQYFCSSACPLPFNGEMRSPSSARSLPPINHPLQSFLA